MVIPACIGIQAGITTGINKQEFVYTSEMTWCVLYRDKCIGRGGNREEVCCSTA